MGKRDAGIIHQNNNPYRPYLQSSLKEKRHSNNLFGTLDNKFDSPLKMYRDVNLKQINLKRNSLQRSVDIADQKAILSLNSVLKFEPLKPEYRAFDKKPRHQKINITKNESFIIHPKMVKKVIKQPLASRNSQMHMSSNKQLRSS